MLSGNEMRITWELASTWMFMVEVLITLYRNNYNVLLAR